nr:MAG TPA: hypothetical protein [Caudoviricetes sp.]DAZ60181.1 MAG TPA: hypothetical protein [Caudoviricetes sp.]
MAALFICYTGNGHSSGPVTSRLNRRLFVCYTSGTLV